MLWNIGRISSWPPISKKKRVCQLSSNCWVTNSASVNKDLFLDISVRIKNVWLTRPRIKHAADYFWRMLPFPQDITQIPKTFRTGIKQCGLHFDWQDASFSLPEHTFLRKLKPKAIGYNLIRLLPPTLSICRSVVYIYFCSPLQRKPTSLKFKWPWGLPLAAPKLY